MQNNNPFGNLSTEGLEAAGDRLGGGGVFESDVYTGKIKYAFAGAADSGAKFFEVHVDMQDGRTYRERMYVTNKAGQNYWERDGKRNPLPGFTIANDLALMSTGFALGEQEFEEKVAKLYDFDAKEEVPKKVQMATGMIGQSITLAILKIVENKQAKNEVTGQYEPIADTREVNNIDKVFHTESGKTVSEFTGKKDAEFQDKWADKNRGRVVDKTKEVGGRSGAPGQGKSGAPAAAGGKPKSLFGG